MQHENGHRSEASLVEVGASHNLVTPADLPVCFRYPHLVCSNLGRLFAAKLRHIGQGTWLRDGVSKRLATSEPGLELWRTKVTKGGRIIWQVCKQ